MKKIILIIAVLFITPIVLAQNSLAKIEYSYAEEAFTKEDYKKALEHIEETKGLLGNTNARIMYLEIRSLENTFSYSRNSLVDYQIYKKLNDLTSSYVSNFEDEVPLEKLKVVYEIQKKHNNYTIEIDNLIRGEKDAEEENIDSAIQYYSIACDAGNAEACKNIAYIYVRKKEYGLMQNFFEQAVSLGNLEAKANKGYYLFYGYKEYSKNKEIGLRLMEEAYNEGFELLTLRLAAAFLGIDDVKAKKLYYKAFKLNMKGSARILFLYFNVFDKEIVEKVEQQNLQDLKKYPKNGYLYYVRYEILNYHKKYPDAYNSLIISCKYNSAISCNNLSTILSDNKKYGGYGQKKDKKKAKEYKQKACALNPKYCE